MPPIITTINTIIATKSGPADAGPLSLCLASASGYGTWKFS